MECNILAICDEQTEYSELLIKQWLRRGDGKEQIHRFSSEEQLREFAKRQEIGCLLVSEFYEGIEDRIEAQAYFCLTKDREKVLPNGKMSYVYRYQSAEQIYACMQSALKKNTRVGKEREAFIDGGTKLIGVYNPVHGSGQTTFAKELAISYQGKGYKSLYLGMEEYVGVSKAGKDYEDLGEIIYYMKQEAEKLPLRLPNFLRRGEGYDYIEPIRMSQELRNISGEEWMKLLQILKEYGGYEVIILDLDSCIQGFVDVIEKCDMLFMPIRMDRRGEEKRGQFFENLERLKHGELYRQMIFVEIPAFEDQIEAGIRTVIEEVITND